MKLYGENKKDVYHIYPKIEYMKHEALMAAKREMHESEDSLIVASAKKVSDGYEVMRKTGEYWCVTRKKGE